jgi:hypothetical protein
MPALVKAMEPACADARPDDAMTAQHTVMLI